MRVALKSQHQHQNLVLSNQAKEIKMPLPYLLHVNSRPQPDSGVDNKLWEKWYITEHVGFTNHSPHCPVPPHRTLSTLSNIQEISCLTWSTAGPRSEQRFIGKRLISHWHPRTGPHGAISLCTRQNSKSRWLATNMPTKCVMEVTCSRRTRRQRPMATLMRGTIN